MITFQAVNFQRKRTLEPTFLTKRFHFYSDEMIYHTDNYQNICIAHQYKLWYAIIKVIALKNGQKKAFTFISKFVDTLANV